MSQLERAKEPGLTCKLAGMWPTRSNANHLRQMAPTRSLPFWAQTIGAIVVDILSLTRPFKPFTTSWSHQLVVVTELIHCGHPRYLAQCYLEYALLTGTMVHFASLILWPTESELEQALRFDVFHVLGLSRLVTMETLLAVANATYYHYFLCTRFYHQASMYQWVCTLVSGRRLWEVFGDGRRTRRLLTGIVVVWKMFGYFVCMAGNCVRLVTGKVDNFYTFPPITMMQS